MVSERVIQFYYAHRSGNNVFSVRVHGRDSDTLGLYLKAAILIAADYNTEPVGRYMARNALVNTCVKDFGCSVADVPWGKAHFTHLYGCAVPLYRPVTNSIKQSELLTIWIKGRIPGTQDTPLFVPIASNLVEQNISLVNPVIALDGRYGPLRLVLIDNAMHNEELLSSPELEPCDIHTILKDMPVRCLRMIRRIEEMACTVASTGALPVVKHSIL
jgi:hypothetical protein